MFPMVFAIVARVKPGMQAALGPGFHPGYSWGENPGPAFAAQTP